VLTGGSGPRRCAVLGSPIAHSLSPVLHRAAYAELGLDWTYEAVELGEDGLAGFLGGLDATWRGLSLTMPLKRRVLPLLQGVTDRARLAGAANTVVLEDGRRWGDNTDVPGAATAVRERWTGTLDRAVVLGGGATAASVLLALADLGCSEATLAVRTPSRAAETVAAVQRHPAGPSIGVVRLGSGLLPEADVLVSTVPAAAQDPALLGVVDPAVVFDVLYDPWPTPLADAARGAGRVVVGGLDLLVHQAVLQVELMTGESVPVTTLRDAGEQALAARAGNPR
jgi:shikimate dehydrogenase